MKPTIKQEIASIIGQKIITTSSVSGGDINEAFQITTKDKTFFVKLNTASFSGDMFEKEAKGLDIIRESQTIPVPDIIGLHSRSSPAFLILDWIESGNPAANFWDNFGQQLAALHQQSTTHFGLNHPNYIGSLIQPNDNESDAISFFINQRLLPQIKLAKNSNSIDTNLIQLFETLFKKLPDLLPDEKPALIHGDLWNGNFMVGKNGQVILVDPSVSYGLREMDLAMTKLFGGFNAEFYDSYQFAFPCENGLDKRIPIYQLYYLMVHVNLFGGGYLNSVREILKRFV